MMIRTILYYDGDLPKVPIFLVAEFALYETLRGWCDNSNMSPFQSTDNGDYLLTMTRVSKLPEKSKGKMLLILVTIESVWSKYMITEGYWPEGCSPNCNRKR